MKNQFKIPIFNSLNQPVMKTLFLTLLIAMLMIISSRQSDGQVAPSTKVEFLNAPVLFKEGGKSLSYHYFTDSLTD